MKLGHLNAERHFCGTECVRDGCGSNSGGGVLAEVKGWLHDGQMVSEPRLTHVALPVTDMDATKAWYEKYTPLVPVHERLAAPVQGDTANRVLWLGHEDGTPFVLVFIEMANAPAQLGPTGHLGIEVESEAEVDRIASVAADDGCLHWEAIRHPPPVGYVCAATDPDGNVVEFSFEQGVYDAVARRR